MDKATGTLRNATEKEKSLWDSLVTHPMQSWAWGDFRRAMGVDVVRITAGRSTRTTCWQMTFHPVPHTPWTIGYFPKGPLPDSEMLQTLTRLGKDKRAIYIQTEPDVRSVMPVTVHDTRTAPSWDNMQTVSGKPRTVLASHFLTTLQKNSPQLCPSHHPLFTKFSFVLDLTLSQDALLKSFHPKTRYNINLAKRHGVTVREDSSDTAVNAYLSLSAETTARQGFYAHDTTYQKTMWRIMHQAGIARLFTATYREKILAAWVVFVWQDTVYYPYGASSREHREVMAPTLLLWEIARWAKAHGFTSFDLWGALGPDPDTRDPWYGFHRFKQGFNPELVEYVGSYDLVIYPPLYRLYKVADTLRWMMLNRKRK